MLQEATKILSSAFTSSFVKKLCLYLHDCVREEVKSCTFRNLNQDKDNKWMFIEGEESLLMKPDSTLDLDGANSDITELMVHADISQKDHYLIYGYLFLVGKSSKKRKNDEFLTPLLYLPCKLERNGMKISCSLTEEILSLNTGALAGLMKYDDEDEVEHLFEGLIDAIPELPLTQEKIQIFLTTLKSLVPEIEFATPSPDTVSVSHKSAVILTKRPTITAGLLHELTQIAEKPSGALRETALNVIQEEYSNSKNKSKASQPITEHKKAKKDEFYPITPLELSESQKEVIELIGKYPLLNVYGPPGTGKSQTIVNLVSHLVASGKTVLVASRMDKAVDVISERLNGLGAPFLCLRAGRANYQKQLNFKLQDLLANKIDLDTGYELSVLTKAEDIKNLIKNTNETAQKCEKILELERNWFEALEIYKKHLENAKNVNLIKVELSKNEIAGIKKFLDKIAHGLKKDGFINRLTVIIRFNLLRKDLELEKFELNEANLEKIALNLTTKEMEANLRAIEASINKIGNLSQLLEDLRESRAKQKVLSRNVLKNQRRESLKSIIRDHFKRQNIIIHSKTLVERKKNLQNRLLHEEDFRPLLDAFPCWAVTTYEVSECLPLKPGLFDVVIIDEASQCDIASSFPVLFRAKTAVVVGDDKQLPHLSFLEKAKEQSFLSQYDIPDRYQLMWRFRTNSIFDLANFYCPHPVLLDEHFRSYPPIINFSNKEFYGNRIRVMNKELTIPDCIELVEVKDAKVDLDSTRNMAEAEKIMEKVQELIINDKNKQGKPTSIGIISPFRGQVELIKKAISQVLNDETVKKHQIEVGTAHTFQGDEKDTILLSFTLASNSHHQSATFLQKPNLFNVAITRARKKLICYISRPVESLQSGLLRSYLEYIESFRAAAQKPVEMNYNNLMEEEMGKLCEAEGLTVVPNFSSAGFNIDMVVSDGTNSLGIECDAYDYRDYKEDQKISKEIWKQSILERCGWKIIRITARDWHYSPKACINRIKSELGQV